MGKGQWLIGMNNGGYSLEIYLALFAIYWLLTVLIEKVFGTLERTLSKGKKAAI
jgi:L-cystine transport system permease protein